MQRLSERFPFLAFQLAVFFSLFGINPTGGVGGEGSFFRQLGWLVLAGMCIFAIIRNEQYQAGLQQMLRDKAVGLLLLVTFLAFALASSRWSEVPFITFKRAFLLGVVMLVCLTVASALQTSSVNLASLLIKPLLALLAFSILFSAAFPRIAFSDIGWQGITGQKNSMGQLSAILIIAALFAGKGVIKSTGLRVAIVLLGLAALGLSRSGTAIVGLVAASAAVMTVHFLRKLKKSPSWIVPMFLAFSCFASLAFTAYVLDWLPDFARLKSSALALLGKSETFTGRTALWDLVLNQSRFRSEIIGGGYGGFWDISSERLAYIVSRLGFLPIQAHNGYLEVFNDLGYVGLTIIGAILLYYILSVLKHVFGASDLAAFHVAFCVYVVGVNFSESSLFRTTQFLNLLFIASFILVVGKRVAQIPPAKRQTHLEGSAVR